MKLHIFSIILSLAVVTSVQANNSFNKEDSLCQEVGSLAVTIMKARQIGVPMSEMMKAMNIKGAQPEKNELARYIVAEAYKKPAYSTKKAQKRAQDDFRNEQELICYENMKKIRNR